MEEEKKLKPHSTPLTLQWLEENYELGDGVCIPRSTLYVHYIDFCTRCSFDPVNAASFGKIIRQQFPQITTRRLGNRGQSKYHYYGIAVKETSIYFEPGFAKKSVKPGSETAQETKHNWIFSPRSKIGTRLPELPRISDLVIPPDVDEAKLETFIMMYKTHCQRVLDIIIRANFDEIKTYLVHFWHGLPLHIHGLLVSPFVANFISYCDLLLYQTITSVVVPSSQQTASESFLQNLKKFASNLVSWLRDALEKTPSIIRLAKLKDGTRFANYILRQISQNGLIAAVRNILQSSETISRILDDLGPLDLDSICRQTAALSQGNQNEAYETMMRIFQDMENVLEEQLSLEEFTKWLNQLIEKEIVDLQIKLSCRRISAARNHLLHWSFFNSRILQELLLLGAESYGTCQLLGLFLEQYAINYIDGQMLRLDTNDLLNLLTGSEAVGQDGTEDIDFSFEIIPNKDNASEKEHPVSVYPTSSDEKQQPAYHYDHSTMGAPSHATCQPVQQVQQLQTASEVQFQQIPVQNYGYWNTSSQQPAYYYPVSSIPWGSYTGDATRPSELYHI